MWLPQVEVVQFSSRDGEMYGSVKRLQTVQDDHKPGSSCRSFKTNKISAPRVKKGKESNVSQDMLWLFKSRCIWDSTSANSWVASEAWNTEAALPAQLLVGEHVLIFDRIIDALLLQRAPDPPPHKTRCYLASAFSKYILIFTFICF